MSLEIPSGLLEKDRIFLSSKSATSKERREISIPVKTEELVAMAASLAIIKSARASGYGLRDQTTVRAKRMEGHGDPSFTTVFETSRLTICRVLHIYSILADLAFGYESS